MGNLKKRGHFSKAYFKTEKGYLLVSTLYFVLFSALFAQSMIKIASNQMIQLNQLTHSYQARAALNMGKVILTQEIHEKTYPSTGQINTSVGLIEITSSEISNGTSYHLLLTTDFGMTYSDRVFFEKLESEEGQMIEDEFDYLNQSPVVTE